MLPTSKVIEIFYSIDEFSKVFDSSIKEKSVPDGKLHRNKPCKMSESEVATILVLFHLGGYRCLKHFYLQYVSQHMKEDFPDLVSYTRFVELQEKISFMLVCFLKMCQLGQCTGISFVDSTKLHVCNNKRIPRHKVFAGIAQRGKSTMGWFYGFKLHLVCNDKGELLNFIITPGNVDDREPLTGSNLLKGVLGKLFADKGYISEKLFNHLFFDGINLITTVRKNMQQRYMTANDRIILRKRAIIETVNDELKNICQIEHTRHRSFANFISNLIGGLTAYTFLPKKPSINVEFEKNAQMFLPF